MRASVTWAVCVAIFPLLFFEAEHLFAQLALSHEVVGCTADNYYDELRGRFAAMLKDIAPELPISDGVILSYVIFGFYTLVLSSSLVIFRQWKLVATSSGKMLVFSVVSPFFIVLSWPILLLSFFFVFVYYQVARRNSITSKDVRAFAVFLVPIVALVLAAIAKSHCAAN